MVPTLASVAAFEQDIVDMFRHDWDLAGRTQALVSIAIVGEAPDQQYLYPEFLLFQQSFERHGLRAVIIDQGAYVDKLPADPEAYFARIQDSNL